MKNVLLFLGACIACFSSINAVKGTFNFDDFDKKIVTKTQVAFEPLKTLDDFEKKVTLTPLSIPLVVKVVSPNVKQPITDVDRTLLENNSETVITPSRREQSTYAGRDPLVSKRIPARAYFYIVNTQHVPEIVKKYSLKKMPVYLFFYNGELRERALFPLDEAKFNQIIGTLPVVAHVEPTRIENSIRPVQKPIL